MTQNVISTEEAVQFLHRFEELAGMKTARRAEVASHSWAGGCRQFHIKRCASPNFDRLIRP